MEPIQSLSILIPYLEFKEKSFYSHPHLKWALKPQLKTTLAGVSAKINQYMGIEATIKLNLS